MALDYGWVYLDRGGANAILLAPESIKFRIKYEVYKEDLPDENYISIELKVVERTIILNNVYFKTNEDAESFVDKIDTLNATGSIKTEVRINSGSMPGSLFNWKSGKYELPTFCIDIGQMEKIAYGDGTVWKVANLKFIQNGQLGP